MLPSEVADSNGERASAPPDFTIERIPFCVRMSLTISASTGEPSLCKGIKRASLSSEPIVGSKRSTSSVLSSLHRVIPGWYSDLQTGQNIEPPSSVADIHTRIEKVINTR